MNPGILPETAVQKFIILDIRATDGTGHLYDIEMQVRKYDDYNQRTLYYLSRMYTEQLEKGDQYGLLKPVIGIHFLDYMLFPQHPDYYFRFELRDCRYPELTLTDDLALYLFEMPKAGRLKEKANLDGGMAEWLHFFNHAHIQGDKTMRTQYSNPNIIKAFDILEKLSADEKTRMLAEQRERALKDEASMLGSARRQGEKTGLEKGEKIGLEKGARNNAIETAARLLKMGVLSAEQIADATGLSTDQVKAMQKVSD
jgi:predicted transposase/invertase (TIGR01784 family)